MRTASAYADPAVLSAREPGRDLPLWSAVLAARSRSWSPITRFCELRASGRVTAWTPDLNREFEQGTAQDCLAFVERDHDGEYILDHAGPRARRLYEGMPIDPRVHARRRPRPSWGARRRTSTARPKFVSG
jgi:hypothetical protein